MVRRLFASLLFIGLILSGASFTAASASVATVPVVSKSETVQTQAKKPKKFAITNRTKHTIKTSRGNIRKNKSIDRFGPNDTITTGKYRFKLVSAGDPRYGTKCLKKNTKYRVGSQINSGLYSWTFAVKC